MSEPRTIGKINAETHRVIGFLAGIAVGTTVTYDQLSAVAGIDVLTRRGMLYTAQRRLREDSQMVFDTIRNVGLIRVEGNGKVIKADATSQKARRPLRTAQKILDAINDPEYAGLSLEDKLKTNVIRTISAIGLAALSSKGQKVLTEVCKSSGAAIPSNEALALFAAR